MKSRSNRHPTSDPPDDWVDESWTVDCICGVNFDDGEEMVNCDECAVWVHTRCVRFVKGEKSFACDKCKSKASRINNDSEETEVAQLLVELPTKTIKMSSGNNNVFSTSNSYAFSNHPPPPPPPRRPPYRLWAHRPMEERVHVQGVPGGADDPSLFQGFPILFGPELWKCSGYVPKKFNFRYREFPCWEKDQDDGDDEAKADGSPENVIDKGAGVLYSLSKENGVVSMRGGQSKGGSSERKGPKERKWENGDSKKISFPGLSKKEKGSGRSIVLHCSNKRNREDLGSSKDRGGKKKSKASHKEQDGKKSKVQGFKAVVIHSTSARQAEVCESKAHKVASIANLSEGSNIEKPKRNAATDEGNLVHRSSEVSGLGCSSDKSVKAEKPGHAATDSSQKSVKTEAVPVLVVEKDNNTINSIKKEGLVLDAMDKNQGVLPVVPEDRTNEFLKPTPPAENVDNAGPEVNSAGVAKEVEATVSLTSGHCVGKTESDSDGVLRSHPPDIDVELHCSEQISSPDRECEDFKQNEAVASSQLRGHEVQDNDKVLEAVSGNQLVKDEELMENQCNNNLKCEGLENSTEVQRTLSDSKEITRVAGEIPKSSGEVLPPPPSYHTIVSTGKSSPSISTIVISRSCLSDKNRAGSSLKHNSTGKRVLSNFSVPKKENAPLGQAKDEDKFEKTKGMLKDHSKSSTSAGLMASQTSKPLMTPSLKHHISLGKDPSRHSFSKKSSTDGAVLPSNIDEPARTQQTQHAPTGQSKNAVSAGQHKGEKVQPNLQSSSKSTQSSLGHLPPSSCAPAGLSDEELALLLHQELNSSPRVPRVPRVRNAGSLPQLSSSSAASIFNKRSASSGGKDQQTFSRRKNKDGSRNSRELDNEARKVDRAPSSPDSVKTSDALTQAECESIHSVRKNVEDVSTSAANSGPSSTDANERKSSSTRDSPVNKPEDDTGTNKGLAPIHRTLPGLIAEIMGAGRRMTYEELCNAVLPHWQNLRKHNGERYAYSSHSQAVLDCLRNRSEWSRLVDRGPKTSASRKKRKVDVEPPNTESEDGEDRTFRNGKSKSFDSNKDEFPKGRRKARKRRRLALRGRGVKDDRKRTKKGAGSDDSGTFSNSSEDSGSSDDSQGSGRAAKSEVSASSADIAAP